MPRRQAIIKQEEFDSIANFVQHQRPRSLTKEERLDILRLHAYFRFQGTPDVAGCIANMLGRSEKVVKQVWHEYQTQKTDCPAPPPSNKITHKSRLPMTNAVVALVQAFVRERRRTRTRTVAKDVLALLVEKKHLDVDSNSPSSFASALFAVRRFLARIGLKNDKISIARDTYVHSMVKTIFADDPPCVVYLDESYIHHHYARHGESLYSLYDPNDEQELQVKSKHKGQRYCFIGAILDDGGKGRRKQPKDYHGMFNGTYFVDWFGTLLDELEKLGKSNVHIVMDNAKYHKSLPQDTPKYSWPKIRLQQACEKYGLGYDYFDVKPVLWKKLTEYIARNIEPIVVTMARSRGHTVVFTPPHHSDLQPIELVWGIVKGQVGRQYTTTTTFRDVLLRLTAAFNGLKPKTIYGVFASP
ncbi:hypothetical protein LEN26_002882 [Aphanomyces euteiches]|nr:hypothetical protein AeMF1_012966 [Aphanomyces euteiches]KAH9158565.1 hypothetical protein LEN26_002882 [Aphanomyces euteiches]KAH9186862.1 hypothetical protein AeNC1_011166 [Aphanomyces euteiches]